MLDFKQEISKFKPFDTGTLPAEDAALTDDAKQSIELYNKALSCLESNNADVAVIQLKRAVMLNPAFTEAMNLLGICHAVDGDYKKALEIFSQAEKADDKNSDTAMYVYAAAVMLYGRRKASSEHGKMKRKGRVVSSEKTKRGLSRIWRSK